MTITIKFVIVMKINQSWWTSKPNTLSYEVYLHTITLYNKFDYGWTNQKTNPVSKQEMKALKWLVINGYFRWIDTAAVRANSKRLSLLNAWSCDEGFFGKQTGSHKIFRQSKWCASLYTCACTHSLTPVPGYEGSTHNAWSHNEGFSRETNLVL